MVALALTLREGSWFQVPPSQGIKRKEKVYSPWEKVGGFLYNFTASPNKGQMQKKKGLLLHEIIMECFTKGEIANTKKDESSSLSREKRTRPQLLQIKIPAHSMHKSAASIFHSQGSWVIFLSVFAFSRQQFII